MLSPEIESALEEATAALNAWLYDEGVGLPVPPDAYEAHAARLLELYEAILAGTEDAATPNELALRVFALENWSETRHLALDNQIVAAMDSELVVPGLASSEGPLAWRNWKAFEREADAAALAAGFEGLVARSAALAPLLAERVARERADFARLNLTPVHTFAQREHISLADLRALLQTVGAACRAPFAEALSELSRVVFGRAAGPAELRALYLNRMYEPCAPLFDAATAVADTLSAFRSQGFDLDHIPLDVEDRPRKYPGAFCFPVSIPYDVRVSVRIASAHHLVDMLYHEFGHAAHFAGIDPDLPFVDRYWIHSGTHETFSTLFEWLLAEPLFLREHFGFDDSAVQQLVAFSRFKAALNGTWLGAAALTVLEAWLEALPWPAVENRFAEHMLAFTGVPMPPGFARLEAFTAGLTIYPAGYVIAGARVAHWERHLRALAGDEAWWRSPAAVADVRARIAAGGQVVFPPEWGDPGEFLRAHVGVRDYGREPRDSAAPPA